jgi:hypothetical protein
MPVGWTMLPDFPEVKTELDRKARILVKLRTALSDSVLRQIRTTLQHEGDRPTYGTVDGQVRNVEYRQIESAMQFSKSEMPDLTVEQIFARLEGAAQDMTRQMAQSVLQQISAATDEAGTSASAGGQPLTFDLYLESIERLVVEFDEDTGQPTFQIVVHPSMAHRLQELATEWQANAEYQARYNALMKRKYEEWREREARRTLVD